jgi:hypothetical protein
MESVLKQLVEKLELALFVFLVVIAFVFLAVTMEPSSSHPTTPEVSETESRQYWSQATPFSITDYRFSGDDAFLVLVNRVPEKLKLKNVSFNGKNLQFFTGENPFQKVPRLVHVKLPGDCGPEGTSFSLNVSLAYYVEDHTNHTQTQEGRKLLKGECFGPLKTAFVVDCLPGEKGENSGTLFVFNAGLDALPGNTVCSKIQGVEKELSWMPFSTGSSMSLGEKTLGVELLPGTQGQVCMEETCQNFTC